MSKEIAKLNNDIILSDAGAGSEAMGQDDIMIPRLIILQSMSPQCNSRDGSYVENAKPGDIYDNVSSSFFSGEDGITVVPCKYNILYYEWKKDRGGLVTVHQDSSILDTTSRGDKGEYFTDEGNRIVPTAEYLVLVTEDDGSFSPALISMSNSQMKRAKQWNAIIRRLIITVGDKRINPAMFWNAYKLTTVPEENDKGSWFGWSIRALFSSDSGGILQNLPMGQDIYLAARSFMNNDKGKKIKVSADIDDDTM